MSEPIAQGALGFRQANEADDLHLAMALRQTICFFLRFMRSVFGRTKDGVAIAGLCALSTAASADQIVLPKTPGQALDIGAFMFEFMVMIVVGKFLFFLAGVLFVLLHIALLLMLAWGLVKRRFWRAGIRFCLIGLVLMYIALGFIIHESRQQVAHRNDIQAQRAAWCT